MFDAGSPHLVVLLASVLKPVDDTRMRGKFAETLRAQGRTQVHVAGRQPAGYATGLADERPGICYHPLFSGGRLSPRRLAAQWRYWRLLRRLRPHLVVVHAPELLPLTLLWQRLSARRRFIYDIRENYALNVSTQQVYRGFTKRLLAAGLRWVETQAAHRSAGLILAEASYAAELPFLALQPAGRVAVLENKYQPAPGEALPAAPRQLPPPTEPLRLLYSGTISVLNGVWEAIALAETLHQAWPGGAHLTIIGFCQQPGLLREVQEKVAQSGFLTLVGGSELVPHARIVAEIGRSHLGLLPYRPHPSTARCRPTKLFEYLAHGLPVLSAPNPLWQALLAHHGAGLPVPFGQPLDGPALVARLLGQSFYPQGPVADALWTPEGKKLWHLVDSCL